MFNKYVRIISSILFVLLLSSCATNTVKRDRAQQSLQVFFERLAQDEYGAAAEQYAGSYETLVSFNPDMDPDDHAALWQSGCQVNGLQCLTIRTTTFKEVSEASDYILSVEFNNQDGSLFELGTCCGGNPTTPSQSRFEYRVIEGEDGQFWVLDMPVYVP